MLNKLEELCGIAPEHRWTLRQLPGKLAIALLAAATLVLWLAIAAKAVR